jgi:hypothetical protein
MARSRSARALAPFDDIPRCDIEGVAAHDRAIGELQGERALQVVSARIDETRGDRGLRDITHHFHADIQVGDFELARDGLGVIHARIESGQ